MRTSLYGDCREGTQWAECTPGRGKGQGGERKNPPDGWHKEGSEKSPSASSEVVERKLVRRRSDEVFTGSGTVRASIRKNRKLMAPVHPGEILREDFMKPLGLRVNKGARAARARDTDCGDCRRAAKDYDGDRAAAGEVGGAAKLR